MAEYNPAVLRFMAERAIKEKESGDPKGLYARLIQEYCNRASISEPMAEALIRGLSRKEQ